MHFKMCCFSVVFTGNVEGRNVFQILPKISYCSYTLLDLFPSYRNPEGFLPQQPAFFPRERFYQSMLTVQATGSIGLNVFWSLYERCGRPEWRDYHLVMQWAVTS